MQNNIKIKVVTKKEMEKVNNELSPKFGERNIVESGTILYEKDKTIFHMVLTDPNPYKPDSMMKNIGQIVKRILGVDEVFHFETQIA